MSVLPMFPLGTVLFPHALLPLHVFEPRYRALVRDCMAGEGEFGVVLIERGSEVGGGDVRTDLGTVARIVEAQSLPDGRWLLLTAGDRRIHVKEWLSDDPYPRAHVEHLPDSASSPGAAAARAEVIRRLRRVLGLKLELGEWTGDVAVELHIDPAVASYQAAALAPIGPIDAYDLLAFDRPDDRLARLISLLDQAEADLSYRLSGA
jgi:Lon protease-like protein